MKAKGLTLSLVLTAALLIPVSARAQVFGGVVGAWAQNSFDGVAGIGGQLGWDLPLLPIDVFGDGTYYFPECDECSLTEWAAGVNLRLPLPLIRPYLTGGWTWKKQEIDGASINPLEEGSDSNGAFVGAGIDVAISGIRVFGEGRYELLDETANLEQWVVRFGIMKR